MLRHAPPCSDRTARQDVNVGTCRIGSGPFVLGSNKESDPCGKLSSAPCFDGWRHASARRAAEDPTKGFKFGGWVMPYFDHTVGDSVAFCHSLNRISGARTTGEEDRGLGAGNGLLPSDRGQVDGHARAPLRALRDGAALQGVARPQALIGRTMWLSLVPGAAIFLAT